MAGFKQFYNGFSTRYYEEQGGKFDLHDVNLIAEDLMNEIMTPRGSRLFMPDFGTRIPLLIFEPNDAATMDVIREDITTVVSHDPRVQLVGEIAFIQNPDTYALVAVAKLNYVEFAVTKDLFIQINSR